MVGGYVLLAYNFVVATVDWLDRAEYVGQRVSDPGWIGKVLAFLAHPPPWFMLLTIFVGLGIIYWHFRQSIASGATTIEPKPNWDIDEAMEYVIKRLGLTSEKDIDRKYRNPARMLTRQAAAGNIHVWGKRISSDGPEVVRREVPAEEWRNRELLTWECFPSTVHPQTRSIIDLPSAYEFTDLHVNATEIKAIDWQSENDLGC